ncbi:MAG: response regulator [Acidimicrobiia bacterium]|nr:response regulator [Acidimicrobiia bacterium]
MYQALDHLERERVDLLLLEVFLPGAGGVDLLRRLSRGPRPARVVALTHATSISRLAPDVCVDDVIHKPVTAGALRAALGAALAVEPATASRALSALRVNG